MLFYEFKIASTLTVSKYSKIVHTKLNIESEVMYKIWEYQYTKSFLNKTFRSTVLEFFNWVILKLILLINYKRIKMENR